MEKGWEPPAVRRVRAPVARRRRVRLHPQPDDAQAGPAAQDLSPPPNSCRQAILCFPEFFCVICLPSAEVLKLWVGISFRVPTGAPQRLAEEAAGARESAEGGVESGGTTCLTLHTARF